MLTRTECRMIAEELHKLQQAEGRRKDERYMSAQEAAEYMRLSVHTLYHRLDEVPHRKQGRKLLFRQSDLQKYMEQ